MAVKKVKQVTDEELLAVLNTWDGLNALLKTADEELSSRLLTLEKTGKIRGQFLLRIHSRFNKLRGRREKQELLTLAGR